MKSNFTFGLVVFMNKCVECRHQSGVELMVMRLQTEMCS